MFCYYRIFSLTIVTDTGYSPDAMASKYTRSLPLTTHTHAGVHARAFMSMCVCVCVCVCLYTRTRMYRIKLYCFKTPRGKARDWRDVGLFFLVALVRTPGAVQRLPDSLALLKTVMLSGPMGQAVSLSGMDFSPTRWERQEGLPSSTDV